jgi:uncharacterized protein (TIGR03000 family)
VPAADRDDGNQLPQPRKLEPEVSAFIELHLPDPAAEVVINGRPTEQEGVKRTFESPPLKPGRASIYEIEARWQVNGRSFKDARTLAVEPGKRFQIDFTEPHQ